MLSNLRNSILLVCICFAVNAQTINVGLVHKQDITQSKITILKGEYFVLQGTDTLFTIKKGQDLFLETAPKKIKVTFKNHITFLKNIQFSGSKSNDIFSISINQNKGNSFIGNLKVSNIETELQLINSVELDDYVAGVVEAEAGYNLPPEYYKLQAVLARTYGLKNLNRHQTEGFDVCNQVHCQAYHHKCSREDIKKAVDATAEMVVVDQDLNLIQTVYHSNCGGQTCNSEDVWVEALPYLRSVVDTFCLNSKLNSWVVRVDKQKVYKKLNWEALMHDSIQDDFIKICQDSARIVLKNVNSLSVTKLRLALGLKSTYFSVENDLDNKDTILIYGKGYGHGVGLCQVGGIEMANLGYEYEDMLQFYYQHVFILNLNSLGVFRK